MVTDTNSVLAAHILGQTITETSVLAVEGAAQDTNNIPFLITNANVGQVTATFWIEKVQLPPPHQHRHFMQLQYTQTVLLSFLGLSWPHLTVATLQKFV